MEKAFCMGLALGMLGGALIIANSKKARKYLLDGQDKVKRKVDDIKATCEEKLNEENDNQE